MLEEAGAAYQRCKHVLPPSWLTQLRSERSMCSAVRPHIEAHMTDSPQRWQRDIRSAGSATSAALGWRRYGRARAEPRQNMRACRDAMAAACRLHRFSAAAIAGRSSM